MGERIVVSFANKAAGWQEDIEIPTGITANDLIFALKKAYRLYDGAEENFDQNAYLKCENPIALLKGERRIYEYQLHDGSLLFYP